MTDALLEEITQEVLRRMQPSQRPTALLIGQPPSQDTGYEYTCLLYTSDAADE